jgi:hypothetical protein
MGEPVAKDILDFESSLRSRKDEQNMNRRGRWEEVKKDFSDSGTFPGTRCHDLNNIFAEKFGEKFSFFKLK